MQQSVGCARFPVVRRFRGELLHPGRHPNVGDQSLLLLLLLLIVLALVILWMQRKWQLMHLMLLMASQGVLLLLLLSGRSSGSLCGGNRHLGQRMQWGLRLADQLFPADAAQPGLLWRWGGEGVPATCWTWPTQHPKVLTVGHQSEIGEEEGH